MKDIKKILALCSVALLLYSCEDAENSPSSPDNEKRFNVTNYNAIEIGGNVVVKIQGEESTSGDQTIIVKGDPQLISTFNVSVTGDVLLVEASQPFDLADSIIVIAPVRDLSSIVLKANQKAMVAWEGTDGLTVLDHVDIKTGANSGLELAGMKAMSINIQQEAASTVSLSGSTMEEEEYKVEKAKVEFLNDSTALVDGTTLWYTDSVSEVSEDGVDYYIFTGDGTRSFFVTNDVTAELQATTELLADELPVNNFDIQLEGQATARIWALKTLTGTGQGASILYYKGSPAIDYLTEGDAQIISTVDVN